MADTPRIMAGIANKQDRLLMLQQLADGLNAEERNALTLMLSRKNGPLAVLPTEIVIQITSYLPILDTWRLQLVSRQWRSVLSSEQVVHSAIQRWNTHNPSDSARKPKTASGGAAEEKGRRMQAIRCGEPVASTTFSFQHEEQHTPPLAQLRREFALKGRHIAYIESYRVLVRDLVTGIGKYVIGTAREMIRGIALTTSFVAFLNYQGKLYVQDLDSFDTDSKEIRLPSAFVSAFAADENICALTFCGHEIGDYTIALYNHDDGSLRAFTASCFTLENDDQAPMPFPHVLLVNAQQSFIDVFSTFTYASDSIEPGMKKRGKTYRRHARYSFAGELLTTSEFVSTLDKTDPRDIAYGDFQPTGNQDEYIFRTHALDRWEEYTENDCRNAMYKRDLYFDSRTATMEERDHKIGMSAIWHVQTPVDSMVWKDVMITCGRSNDSVHLTFSTVEDEAPRSIGDGKAEDEEENEQPHKKSLPLTKFRLQRQFDLNEEYALGHPETDRSCIHGNDTLYVNDTFLVAVGHTPRGTDDKTRRIHVFCFDEGL